MVLVQIYVPQALNNTHINVPLYGTYDVSLVGIQYHDAPVLARPMEIQSDILRVINSSSPYLMFINQAHTNIASGSDSGRMISIPNCDFNGKVLINLLDKTTGIEPVGMQYLLISLEVVKK